jgi:hypothetical protein
MVATVAGIHLGLDIHANRPAGNAVPDGSFYSCSTHGLIYKSDFAGNSWATWATLGGTGLADMGTFTYLDATEAAAPATPASGKARLYAKTDGRIYSKDDAGTEYGPFDVAGGGGGSTGGFPVDVAPTTAHAKDDEFSGSSLDPKWTNPLSTDHGAAGIIVAGGALKLDAPATPSKKVTGIRQPAPTGSFTVSASVVYTDSYTFDMRCGVFAAVTGGKGHVVGPQPQDNNGGYIGVTTVSNVADWSGYDGTVGGGAGLGAYIGRYRIRWDAATSTIYWDCWRAAWVNLGSRASMTQPDQIGVCMYTQSLNMPTTPEMYVDWFRVTEP